MNKEKTLYPFMDGFNDDSLNDGAWQCMLEQSVLVFNEANGTDYDSFEEWINYVQWKCANQAS